ncbi:FAD-binding and (Fe-S)-binding domain-containing protein [Micropruina sonneratiae]|uniref:FAD-binding and (Fe-S)-binding domain-containing protein n=1 Tax=Micropruina sonneratiae TaxID=2986940 RepID=UPI002226AA5A|nr:FAD-binding and (Fe-S)-binding domain-containing protein [Micropruina sp. KQZ13P-5]MCW3158233.1 FAD-binding oxidoreductase [Micropruina sp. KQZ13P-5]
MGVPAFDRSTLSRALYSSDASLYRVVPQAVCAPATLDELDAAVEHALTTRLPLTMRGAGTSCAGNAVGPGLIIDTRRLDAIESLDATAGVAVVQPGVVQAHLSAAASPHGLRFGPDPSTASRCTVGGMIGNNACGPRALGYGRTSDVVAGLEVITGTGELLLLEPGTDLRHHASGTLAALRELVNTNLGVIRTEFGRFGRQISGYSLEHLLPEHGFDVARFLVGSEGTLAVVRRATVRLVRDPAHTALVLLGYASLAAAADAMSRILEFAPRACEGLDARIVRQVLAKHGADALPPLPPGRGWLIVELAGDDAAELAARTGALAGSDEALGSVVIDDPDLAGRWWRLRSDAAGYAGVAFDRPAHTGWEDAAVPPDRLGGYLRAFEALLAAHGLRGLPYGHFGEGCVHCRIDFPLGAPDGTARYRSFVEAAADLVAGYGGSMSGEHGDGRARSELLPRMYSPAALRLFAAVKRLFDPGNLLNPGVLVDPEPLDSAVRLASVPHPMDAFAADVHRCTGVGRCVSAGTSGAMCPSYQVTRAEKDSTRGRARVLQELVNGTLIASPRSPEVAEALDLCLACKACATECPTGVDLARDKSRLLERAHAGRLQPLTHYSLGWLPRWTRLVGALPGLAAVANTTLSAPLLRRLLLRVAGVDTRRRIPPFRTGPVGAGVSGRSDARVEPAGTAAPDASDEIPSLGRVAVWVDSFSAGFAGDQVAAAVSVLSRAGYRPELVGQDACCGLTWITTGQRAAAGARLRRSLDVLGPLAEAGVPIVGVEPSCLAVWRDEASDLVDDPRVALVRSSLRTLAELLAATPGWRPPQLAGRTIVVQPHCHHVAVLGWTPDAELLRATGATVVTVTGCCGLAGNFGVERGHYETSVAVAGLHLLPALDAAPADALVLADGFSCRTQITDLTPHRALTLAELLARAPQEL